MNYNEVFAKWWGTSDIVRDHDGADLLEAVGDAIVEGTHHVAAVRDVNNATLVLFADDTSILIAKDRSWWQVNSGNGMEVRHIQKKHENATPNREIPIDRGASDVDASADYSQATESQLEGQMLLATTMVLVCGSVELMARGECPTALERSTIKMVGLAWTAGLEALQLERSTRETAQRERAGAH